jgi:hypothetical protein
LGLLAKSPTPHLEASTPVLRGVLAFKRKTA